MKNYFITIFFTFAISIIPSEQDIQKRDEEVLSIVTQIKPLQQIIRDYLDLPDQLVHTIKMSSQNHGLSCSNAHLATWSLKNSSKPKTIAIRDLITGIHVSSIVMNKRHTVNNFILSADSEYFAYQEEFDASTIEIYDLKTKKIKFRHRLNKLANTKFAFLNDGSQLVVADYFAREKVLYVTIYQTKSGEQIKKFTQKFDKSPLVFLHFSQEGEYLSIGFTLGTASPEIYILHVRSQTVTKVDCRRSQENKVFIKWPILSPNGRYLLAHAHCYDLTKSGNQIACELPDDTFRFAHTPNYLIASNETDLNKFICDWPVYTLPIAEALSGYPIFLKNGAYMVVAYNYDAEDKDEERIIRVFKNQAFDLDCQSPPKITRIDNDRSSCAIA